MANTTTKTYQDGDPLLEDDLDNLYENLQSSLPNLALSTTGSASGDLLASQGSNLAPHFVSPDVVGANMTSTGANAIFADITSPNASVAALVVNAINSCSAPAANIILDAISSCSSLAANIIFNRVSSTNSATSNVVADGVVRPTGSVVSHLGVGVSLGFSFSTTHSTFVNATSMNCQIDTSGRPVWVGLVNQNNSSGAASAQLAGVAPVIYGEMALLRNSVIIGIFSYGFNSTNATGNLQFYGQPGTCQALDFPSAGTQYYSLQMRGNGTETFQINNCPLVAYELT